MRAVRDVVNDGGDELDDHVAVPADEVDERSHARCAPAGCSRGFLRGSYPGSATGLAAAGPRVLTGAQLGNTDAGSAVERLPRMERWV
jgi:hypothetical protein